MDQPESESESVEILDQDAAQLAALGYKSNFRREMGLWANFSLGFTYLSPVVGAYSLYAYSLSQAGPPVVWSFFIAGVGQFFVALVFGEIVSQYPLSGGVYSWVRRLWGKPMAWLTGWTYLCALYSTVAAVAYGAGPHACNIVGIEQSTLANVVVSLLLVWFAGLVNFSGTRSLALASIIGCIAELGGAVFVGFWLIIFERKNDFAVVFNRTPAHQSNYFPRFSAGALLGLYQFYGFEACADVAEEVLNPSQQIPKAMRRTIYIGGTAAVFITYALVIATPDIDVASAVFQADLVDLILRDAFGEIGMKMILLIVMLSFISCTISLQAAVSRLTYAYARDEMIFGWRILSRFSEARHVPPYSLLLAIVLPSLVTSSTLLFDDPLTKIVSFGVLGIYMSFQLVVLAALRARILGWKPTGSFQLGRAGIAVNALALAYGMLAMLDLVWPHTNDGFFNDFVVLLSALVVVGVGTLYMAIARPYNGGNAAAADAVPMQMLH